MSERGKLAEEGRSPVEVMWMKRDWEARSPTATARENRECFECLKVYHVDNGAELFCVVPEDKARIGRAKL